MASKEFQSKIAASLKRFRKEFKLSQQQVADTLGIKQPSYQIYESKSGSVPSAEVIFKLANAYNVTTDYLLGRTDEPRPPKLDAKSFDLIQAMRAFQAANAAAQVPAQ